MTHYIKLLLLTLLISSPGFAQNNVFDCNESKRFAGYLFNTNQFELAQHELERVLFFCDMDTVSQLRLLKTYRKQKQFTKANVYFTGKSTDELITLPADYRMEYIRLLMVQKEYEKVNQLINEGLRFEQQESHQLGTLLLNRSWEEAYALTQNQIAVDNFKFKQLQAIAKSSYASKRKNNILSSAMSAIIPGSGKMYCGYWGDGIISFLFTASSAFFAYRAFDKYGTQNAYTWILSGLAVSYYVGNIYGGNRAAVRYNEKLEHDFIHETENILFSDY